MPCTTTSAQFSEPALASTMLSFYESVLVAAEATSLLTACSKRGPRFCARLIISCTCDATPQDGPRSDLAAIGEGLCCTPLMPLKGCNVSSELCLA